MLRLIPILVLVVASTFAQEPAPATSAGTFAELSVYDPGRSAHDDVLAAQAEAKRTGKRVLLEIGGEWCKWCHIMDRTFAENPDLLALRRQNYVTVKVNVSRENMNKEALKRFGEIPGFPYLIVLDADGKVVRKQNTGDLESGRGYDLDRFRKFLEKYAPKKS
ncbi:MAG TPA: thioredoxin family protein [Burkholderiales bacterium]|jgi:thiol:disulfide interchange protein|nr:thioredoxin family protein [Burkholderiales bacterium]